MGGNSVGGAAMNMQRLSLTLPHATSVRHASSGGSAVAARRSGGDGGGGGGGGGASPPYANATRGCELMPSVGLCN